MRIFHEFTGWMSETPGINRNLRISRKMLGLRKLTGSKVWHGIKFPGKLLVDTPTTGECWKVDWKWGAVKERQFGRRLKHAVLPTYFATLGADPLPWLLWTMIYSARLMMPTWTTE